MGAAQDRDVVFLMRLYDLVIFDVVVVVTDRTSADHAAEATPLSTERLMPSGIGGRALPLGDMLVVVHLDSALSAADDDSVGTSKLRVGNGPCRVLELNSCALR